jgi:hypothetical protein
VFGNVVGYTATEYAVLSPYEKIRCRAVVRQLLILNRLCKNTMISRTAFCSAQAVVMRLARTGPMPSTSRSRSGVASIMSNTFSPKARRRPGRCLGSCRRTGTSRCRRPRMGRCAQEPRLELLAVCPIVDPFA